jgi:hypothetical protein
MDADKTKKLFLFWLAAKNKKHFPICARAQNVNLFLPFRRADLTADFVKAENRKWKKAEKYKI